MKHFLIIGSGIGGMASGALLAKAGHRVTVWEQHPELLGGHGRSLTFGGLSFSMGPQYVWDFGKGDIGERFLRFLDIHKENPFLPMAADGFEHLFIGHKKNGETNDFLHVCVPMGFSPFCRRLQKLFPEEQTAIYRLLRDMEAIYEAYRRFFRCGGNSAGAGRILPAVRFLCAKKPALTGKSRFGKSIFQTLRSFFNQYGISERVRRILYGHGGIFAENESQMSAIAYIIGTGNYHRGAWYPENGFPCFFDSMARVIEASGGAVVTGKRAVRLRSESGRITQADAEDGAICRADCVISDISPRLTCSLLDSGGSRICTDYEPSHSIISCCIGLSEGFATAKNIQGANCWWQSGGEVDYHDPDVTAPPAMLFAAPAAANGEAGGRGAREVFASRGLVVFCPGNYAQEKALCRAGKDSFERFKNELAANVIDILEQNVFPGIRERVRFCEVVSSLDTSRDTLGELGNAYGRRLSAEEVRKGPIRMKSMPENLVNVSATCNSPGIAAGIATGARVLERLAGIRI